MDAPSTGDVERALGDLTVFVAPGLEGIVDVEPPHERLVLRTPD